MTDSYVRVRCLARWEFSESRYSQPIDAGMMQGLVGITSNPVLANGIAGLATTATAFAAVERTLLYQMRNDTVEPFNETVQQVFSRISALRDSLDGPQVSFPHVCFRACMTLVCLLRCCSSVLTSRQNRVCFCYLPCLSCDYHCWSMTTQGFQTAAGNM